MCGTFSHKLSIPEHCFSGFLHIHGWWEDGWGEAQQKKKKERRKLSSKGKVFPFHRASCITARCSFSSPATVSWFLIKTRLFQVQSIVKYETWVSWNMLEKQNLIYLLVYSLSNAKGERRKKKDKRVRWGEKSCLIKSKCLLLVANASQVSNLG